MSFVYKFEDYCLDSDRRELRRGADLVTVEPQVFDLLEYLIRNRDRIVGKDDLIAGVWNGRIVSDSTLSSRITATRQAIGDNGEQQRLIRTISRKGNGPRISRASCVHSNKNLPISRWAAVV